MRCLGRLIGCLLLVMVVAITPAILWFFTMWNIISNADKYTSTLDDKAYEELALLVLPAVAQSISDGRYSEQRNVEGEQAAFFSRVVLNLSADEWKAAADGLIEPEWVRHNLNSNLTNIFAFEDYKTDTLAVLIDLAPVATAFDAQGDALITAMVDAIAARENCTTEQRNQYEAFLNPRNPFAKQPAARFPNCNPGTETLAVIRTRLEDGRTAVLDYLNELPNYQWDLRHEAARTQQASLEDVDKTLAETRKAMVFLNEALIAILLIPIMLLSLIVVFAVRSAREFFFWMGLPLLTSGLFTLFPLVPWIYGLVYNDTPGVVTDSSYQLGLRFQRWAFSAFSGPILAEVLVLLGIGLVCLVLAGLIRERQPQQPIYYVMPSTAGFPAGQYVQTTTPTPQPVQVINSTPQPKAKIKLPALPPAPPPPPMPKTRRKDEKRSTDSRPIEVRYVNPEPSSAADRYKEQLSQPASPEDMTFIPTDDIADDE